MHTPRILIVEDSLMVVIHLQAALESRGLRVIGKFDSGEDALTFLENEKPDVVLLDIMLNGELSGIQTAHKIKERYNLPVIFLTALTDQDTLKSAAATQPHGYLSKPFADQEMYTLIEQAMSK